VLLAGAGGASYGVMEPLLRELPQTLVVANRTLEKAVALAGHFEELGKLATDGVAAKSYDALHGTRFDIVINATSAGLADAMPPLPRGIFAPGALAYDMVYGRRTPFMRFAMDEGARAADGLGMLVEQAAESFFIWRGVRPATAPVIRALRMKAEG
jgi:shikimate dehydrogenase